MCIRASASIGAVATYHIVTNGVTFLVVARDVAALYHRVHLQDKSPDYESYCLLAEAFLAVQEPDKAAQAYEVHFP